MSMGRIGLIGMLISMVLGGHPGAWAQEAYPNRPIKIIVPWAPGSPVDLGVRFFSDKWAEFLGQPVVVMNKPGAGGALASKSVAFEKPDGYTLLSVSDSSIISSRLERKDAGFNLENFSFILAFSDVVFFFSVKADSKWKTLQDFLMEAKDNPHKLKYGALGPNNALVMATNMLSKVAGIKLTLVPFRSSADTLAALVQGNIDLAVTWGLPGIGKSPMIRPLAVGTDERVSDLPQVPTLKELGYAIKYHSSPNALVAPVKSPEYVLSKFTEVHNKARAKYARDMKEKLPNLGQYPIYIEGKLLMQQYREKEKLFKAFYDEIGFKPE